MVVVVQKRFAEMDVLVKVDVSTVFAHEESAIQSEVTAFRDEPALRVDEGGERDRELEVNKLD